MESRLKRSKSWSVFIRNCLLALACALLLCTLYINVFENSPTLSSEALMLPGPSGVSGGQGGSNNSLLASLILRAEGPLEFRNPGNNSGRVELVLTMDTEDLQDMVEEYKQSITPTKPRYPTDTSLILNSPNLCKDSPNLDYIIYVHSAVFNYERRQLLRATWANMTLFKNYKFRVIFLVGKSASEEDQILLKEEFSEYGDIVQGNFEDHYRNLTYKAVMGLKWISSYCPQARYGLKADDDTFMNIFGLVREMKKHRDNPSTIICPLWGENMMPILREKKTCMKWCVKKKELPGRSHFPQYCAGIGFAISGPLIKSLYKAAESTPFFWIDDVYITGLLPKKVNETVNFVSMSQRFQLKENQALDQMKILTEPVKYYFVHTHNRHTFIALWNLLLDRLDDEDKAELSMDPSHFKQDTSL